MTRSLLLRLKQRKKRAPRWQDVDQYHTGFSEWKGQLFSRLGVDKAHVLVTRRTCLRGEHLAWVVGQLAKHLAFFFVPKM